MLLLSESCFMGAMCADDARRYLDYAAGRYCPGGPGHLHHRRSCQAAARPRGQAEFGIVFPFFGLRCSPDRSPGASGCQRPTDSFIHWRRKLCVFLQFLLHLAVTCIDMKRLSASGSVMATGPASKSSTAPE